jgi:CubicO group peptidase (beta-lactamase class C family)
VAAALTVLDAWITATVAQREQPGLSIGIVYDQDLIWAKGYGYADLQRQVPATPTTIYRIASISKLFTATAIMQLRDAGKLRLDDAVSDRLSWFSIKKTYEGGPPITVRNLITHTSGLPREVTLASTGATSRFRAVMICFVSSLTKRRFSHPKMSGSIPTSLCRLPVRLWLRRRPSPGHSTSSDIFYDPSA